MTKNCMLMYQDTASYHSDIDAESAWKRVKWSKFSASEIDNLMTKGKSGLFSTGGIAYIERIAREAFTVFNDDENNETFLMKRGKIKESEAFAYYCRMIGTSEFDYYGGGNPYFELYSEFSGASPDCILWKDKKNRVVSFGAEFKCPSSKIHFEYIRNVKDQWDLKGANSLYYGQCQMNLMTFNADLWHWCSYNEYYPFKNRMLIIEVQPDRAYQSELKIRIKQAEIERNKLLSELKSL